MYQQRHAKPQEYQRAAQLLAKLLELDTGTEQKIGEYIQNYGISHFFNNLEAFNLCPDALEKLQTLNLILCRFVSDKKELELESYNDGGDE